MTTLALAQQPLVNQQAPTPQPLNRTLKPPTAVNTSLPIAGSPANRAAPSAPAPALAPVAPAAPLPLATAPGASPYATSATNTPGSPTDYTNKTITPGAGTDRLALAKSNFENFRASTEPEYEATLRKAGQSGAAAGQVGSGMLRGTLGDIGLARTRDLQSAETGFLNNATEGGIGDAYRNIGIAQQQQGYQSGQQQTAFQQQLEQQQLEEMLRSGAFGRSATTLGLGEQGNPSDIALALSGIYGKQSSGAGQAAGSLLGNSQLQDYLKRYGSGIAPGTPDANGVPQVTQGGLPIDIGSLIH